MDLFLFCSKSETQGMVLTEAMAAGIPVVALDASGVREVVVDGENGRLLYDESVEQLVAALQWVFSLPADRKKELRQNALQTAGKFSMPRVAAEALGYYQRIQTEGFVEDKEQYNIWQSLQRLISIEWQMFKNLIEAADAAVSQNNGDKEKK
jgi:glycogen synthase